MWTWHTLARHGPWPVRKLFIRDRVWRGRWKPGCRRTVGSVTIVSLTTEGDDQSRLHCVIVSTDVISHHIGCWAMKVDAQRHQHTQANLDGLWWSEADCQLPLHDIEKEVQHCWALAAMRAACVAGSLKSGTLLTHYCDTITASGQPHSNWWWCLDISYPLLDAEHSLCMAPWSGTPCRTTSAHSRTMSPLDWAWKPGFSLDTSVFSTLETFVIIALYKSTFTIPYHASHTDTRRNLCNCVCE